MMKKIMVVFGTRPEAIKMCPLVLELKKRQTIQTVLCITGQHRQMLDQVLEAFHVTPEYNLSIMKEQQTLFDVTAGILEGIRKVLESEKPDVVLIHGDTSTTFATALACYYLQIPVGHVEAGLRTYNIYSPYPEEFNRQAAGSIARYHFAPTELSRQNLLRECKKPESIFVTGNTAIDALRTTVRENYTHSELEWAKGSRLIMLTAHRRENLGEPMHRMFRAIRRIIDEYPDTKAIYPIHMNPVVREAARDELGMEDRIHIIEPLDVLDFHNFLARAYLILTDSGGIQEEAPSLGKPVLVMRDTTERPEGVQAGTLKLVGTSEDTIYRECKRLLDDADAYTAMSKASNPYGDGHACERIAGILEMELSNTSEVRQMMNSRDYWEDRFSTGDWLQNGGEDQSSFFSTVAYDALPDWLKAELAQHSWSLYDYGCAQGGGTSYLAEMFPSCKVTGIDFSQEAIKAARAAHANCGFIEGDITKEIIACDVIFSSNTLEHFHDPMPIFRALVQAASKYAVFMLPFEDDTVTAEHFFRFTADLFPDRVGAHDLSAFQVIDCRRLPNSYWQGSQLLLVYTNSEYKQKSGFMLGQIYADTLAPLLKKAERMADAASAEQARCEQLERELGNARAEAAAFETRRLNVLTQLKQSDELQIAGLRDILSEREAALGKAEAENKALAQKQSDLEAALAITRKSLREEEEKIAAALVRLQEMAQFKSFKLLHLWTRFRRQGLCNIQHERKNFRRWLFAHVNRSTPDSDRRYNYLYSVINLLNVPSKYVFEQNAKSAAPLQLDLQTQKGKLAEHLKLQNAAFDAALARPLSAKAEKLRKAFAERKYKGILVYPHCVFWEPLQTPQQILRVFAQQGWLCLFCESPYSKGGYREVEPNLFITYESDALQAIGDTPVTVLLTWMGSLSFVDRIPKKTIWYHLLDHLGISLYYDQLYEDLHQQTLKAADTVSYVARPLSAYTGERLDAVYLPNGVNASEISTIRPGFVPKDMKPILEKRHTIIGYFGYLAEWMDFNMVRQLALLQLDWEFVMIGKVLHDVSAISDLPNVHLLGLKPYKELSDYAKFFNVATIPFLVDEKMDCVSPIKFYEYLALGKPVVSSAMKELEPFAKRYGFVECANGADEFLFYFKKMMSPEIVKDAQINGPTIAKDNSWAARAELIEPMLLNQNTPILDTAYTKPDVIVLSIIDYSFRHQRPQHIAQRLAQAGHRIYFVNSDFAERYATTLLEERLWQVALAAPGKGAIHQTDCNDCLETLTSQLDTLIEHAFIRDAIILVDYPNWIHTALYLRGKYGFRIMTDYMDDFTGFQNSVGKLVKQNCERLLRESDGVMASSQYLFDIAHNYNRRVVLNRNGTDYEYFHQAATGSRPGNVRPVIGYYGAIAEWFSMDVVRRCAQRFPDCDIVLVGAVTVDRKLLMKYENVIFAGEVQYAKLTGWLRKFDVCLIPFDATTDLIRATNPVKFYEYLSAGKKIVATRIPELEPYRDRFAYLENDPELFCDAVQKCLNGTDALADAQSCMAFAKENDWGERARVVEQAITALYPKISVVVLCYNQLDYTKQCVDSVLNNTAYPNYELVLVDNCSTDGTAAYLQELDARVENVKIVLNKTNRGFAGGNNDGIAVSDGEYFVLLNNDTLVTRGWLTGMLKHFKNGDVGLVGPVTNSIANEAKINVAYAGANGMQLFAMNYTFRHMGEEYPHHGVLAMFCLMISRELYEKAGPLDENYGTGMFEDDDYSTASQRLGYRNVMAEDVFIHHFGNVSFSKLTNDKYTKLLHANKTYYEKKWKTKWTMHKLRGNVL